MKASEGSHNMTNDEAQVAVIEALSIGLTLNIKAMNGDCLRVGCASVSRTRKSKRIYAEYYCDQTFGCYVSRDVQEVASLAVERGGRKIGTLAKREIINFVINTKNRLS
jgi:hypothetical protein